MATLDRLISRGLGNVRQDQITRGMLRRNKPDAWMAKLGAQDAILEECFEAMEKR